MPIEETPAKMESTASTHPKASSSALEKSVSKMSVHGKDGETAVPSISLPSILSEEPQPSTSVAASFRSISGGANRKVVKRTILKKEKKPKKAETIFTSFKKKRFQYDLSQVGRAIEAIKNDSISVRAACALFEVPRSTIRNKLACKAPMESTGHCGPITLLGQDIEDILVDWMIGCADMGFLIHKEDLLCSVKRVLDEKNVESPYFVNNRPGRRWYEGFYKRYPVLQEKQKEERGLHSAAKRSLTVDEVKEWFRKVRNSLGTNVDVLNHPDRVFCMDEICFSFPPNLDPQADKEHISTFFVVSAEGDFLSPLTLFKIGKVPETAPPNWHIGATDKGLMTGESFYEYFVYVFHQYLTDNNIARPVIVFLNGLKSHLTFHLSKFCWSQDIILIAQPPNAKGILQPLDIAVLRPIKGLFKRLIQERRGGPLDDIDIPTGLFRIVSDERMKNSVVEGFAEAGIYPFDETKVDYSKCSTSIVDIVQVKNEYSPGEKESNLDISTLTSTNQIESDSAKTIRPYEQDHNQIKTEGIYVIEGNNQIESNNAIVIRPYEQDHNKTNIEHLFVVEECIESEQSKTNDVLIFKPCVQNENESSLLIRETNPIVTNATEESSNKPTKTIEIYQYLQFIESRINPSSLFEFKRTLFNQQEWGGNPHDLSLFQFWKRITEEAMAPVVKEKN